MRLLAFQIRKNITVGFVVVLVEKHPLNSTYVRAYLLDGWSEPLVSHILRIPFKGTASSDSLVKHPQPPTVHCGDNLAQSPLDALPTKTVNAGAGHTIHFNEKFVTLCLQSVCKQN